MKVSPAIYDAFQTVMRTGTMSGAAAILGRSQPAVSRMIDKLEDSQGVKLFERRKGKVVPTHAAHLLLDEVERLFVSLGSLEDFGRRMQLGQDSGVGVAALPALGLDFMPRAIARFRRNRPHARVLLNVRMSVSVEKWVATQQVDFGLAETPFRLTGFETKIFADADYVVAIPDDHRLSDVSEVHPTHLVGEEFIGWTHFVSARPIFDDIMQGAGIVPQQLVESTMSASICSLVREHQGLAVVDPFTAWAQRGSGLTFRPFRPRIPCRFALLQPEMRALSALAQELIGEIETLRDEALGDLFR
ncbi:LysR family transcriptional regulator [Palleronia sp. LCG004]|uniref:LysR family transcriptional regulator n=1 Tax=Palleronia sp. LCG004 TaxID=3079304 RepID=UPI0029425402|nr:LysR family transcriptional regulator [Palleronia sp. LCG004]WOI56854.1 LysR family transcriptional regulator [Palleronia sp. LCG004]